MGQAMTPTAKQITFAASLFNSIAANSAKHGAPLSRKDYREDMIWLEMDPDNRADVSKYIDLHMTAKAEARMTMRRS